MQLPSHHGDVLHALHATDLCGSPLLARSAVSLHSRGRAGRGAGVAAAALRQALRGAPHQAYHRGGSADAARPGPRAVVLVAVAPLLAQPLLRQASRGVGAVAFGARLSHAGGPGAAAVVGARRCRSHGRRRGAAGGADPAVQGAIGGLPGEKLEACASNRSVGNVPGGEVIACAAFAMLADGRLHGEMYVAQQLAELKQQSQALGPLYACHP
mmetsp:Transcript_137909/g.384589  ORF Transcript_137909/g.384589 Transcript_137909/m.384589 type:complete len:213 (-) Transcript_137909:176-814(-)